MPYRDYKKAGGGGKHLNLHDFATMAIDGVQYVWEIKGGMRETDSGKWDGTRKLYISTFEDAQALFQSFTHPVGGPCGLEALKAAIKRGSPDCAE